MVDEGDRAPDFALPDERGRPVRLADLRGRPVVLTFYAEDFTPACTDQVCGFRDAWDDVRATGATLLAVSPDPVERHAQFAREMRLPFRLLSDPTKRVMRRWGAWGEKTMYGRKVEGVIRSTFVVGADGRVAVAMRRIRTKGHAERVLAALGRL